jgi:hypothetical protein
MSRKIPEKKWVRKGYETLTWLKEGYVPGFQKIRSDQFQPDCWYCNKPIARLALELTKEDHTVWFHVGCFKRENRYEERTVDSIGKWHAIYGQVERAESRGICLDELVAYCRISRAFVKKYLASMVKAGKFAVVRRIRNGRLVEYYVMQVR